MPHNLKQSACRSFRYIGQRWSESQGPLLIRRYHASTLQRPCPTPAVAAAQSDVKVATLATNGSPLLTTNHPSDVPCLLPGRIERVRVSIASPAHRSLPQLAGGSTSALLLKLHSRYSPSDRSAAQRTLSRGSSPASYPAKPLRQLPDQSIIVRHAATIAGASIAWGLRQATCGQSRSTPSRWTTGLWTRLVHVPESLEEQLLGMRLPCGALSARFDRGRGDQLAGLQAACSG